MNVDQIAMCCISMDSSKPALLSNGKNLSNFKLIFGIVAENRKFGPKTEKYSNEILMKLQCVL